MARNREVDRLVALTDVDQQFLSDEDFRDGLRQGYHEYAHYHLQGIVFSETAYVVMAEEARARLGKPNSWVYGMSVGYELNRSIHDARLHNPTQVSRPEDGAVYRTFSMAE